MMTSSTRQGIDPQTDLPIEWDVVSKGINRPVNSTLNVHFQEDDSSSGDDNIGNIDFTFSDYSQALPNTIRKQKGELIIELNVRWK